MKLEYTRPEFHIQKKVLLMGAEARTNNRIANEQGRNLGAVLQKAVDAKIASMEKLEKKEKGRQACPPR